MPRYGFKRDAGIYQQASMTDNRKSRSRTNSRLGSALKFFSEFSRILGKLSSGIFSSDTRTGMLDTLIDLDSGKPGNVDYSMSLRGPLRAPTLGVEPNRRR